MAKRIDRVGTGFARRFPSLGSDNNPAEFAPVAAGSSVIQQVKILYLGRISYLGLQIMIDDDKIVLIFSIPITNQLQYNILY